jgi:hypothetical protein
MALLFYVLDIVFALGGAALLVIVLFSVFRPLKTTAG